jgi:hypothetical protein
MPTKRTKETATIYELIETAPKPFTSKEIFEEAWSELSKTKNTALYKKQVKKCVTNILTRLQSLEKLKKVSGKKGIGKGYTYEYIADGTKKSKTPAQDTTLSEQEATTSQETNTSQEANTSKKEMSYTLVEMGEWIYNLLKYKDSEIQKRDDEIETLKYELKMVKSSDNSRLISKNNTIKELNEKIRHLNQQLSQRRGSGTFTLGELAKTTIVKR